MYLRMWPVVVKLLWDCIQLRTEARLDPRFSLAYLGQAKWIHSLSFIVPARIFPKFRYISRSHHVGGHK